MGNEEGIIQIERIIRKYHAVDNQGIITVWNPKQAAREIIELFEQPTHKKINGVDGYYGPDIPTKQEGENK